jgi:hypothetical protein
MYVRVVDLVEDALISLPTPWVVLVGEARRSNHGSYLSQTDAGKHLPSWNRCKT